MQIRVVLVNYSHVQRPQFKRILLQSKANPLANQFNRCSTKTWLLLALHKMLQNEPDWL